jgi:hypothetical protein
LKLGSQLDSAFELPCEDIIKLYNEGVGILSIAVRLKIPAAKIRRYLTEGNRIAEYNRKGKSQKHIRKVMAVSKDRIRAISSLGMRERYYEPHDGKGLPDYMI